MAKTEFTAPTINDPQFDRSCLEEKVAAALACLQELMEENSHNTALSGAVVDALAGVEEAGIGRSLAIILENRISNIFLVMQLKKYLTAILNEVADQPLPNDSVAA